MSFSQIPASGLRIPRLILASASPRRREILEAAEIAFEVIPSKVDETQRTNEHPEAYALRVAEDKARDVLSHFEPHSEIIVLGADTIVVVDSQTLGKPVDAGDAKRMLRLLSGREHRVLTAVCLARYASGHPSERILTNSQIASTLVKFMDLNDREIESYVASGEPFDKAGAYAIQGLASKFVEWIDGDYFNVVGLPVSLVYRMLQQ